MGLNFRKSINLGKGFRVNLSKSGVGTSWGVPGFRISKSAAGQTRTTVGIPGSGLSYTQSIGSKSKKKAAKKSTKAADETPRIRKAQAAAPAGGAVNTSRSLTGNARQAGQSGAARQQTPQPRQKAAARQPQPQSRQQGSVSFENLKTIHRSADESIDWNEIASSPEPPSDMYDRGLWKYCYSKAAGVLSGDIDTYLQVIQDINPYDDLLELGSGFEFGTDSPLSMTVEFSARCSEVMPPRSSMSRSGYEELRKDYICSVAIRAARDTFAILPVNFVTVIAVDGGSEVLNVRFDRSRFTALKFGMADPSDIIAGFPNSMAES